MRKRYCILIGFLVWMLCLILSGVYESSELKELSPLIGMVVGLLLMTVDLPAIRKNKSNGTFPANWERCDGRARTPKKSKPRW